MSDRRIGPILSLLRQGLELDVEYGTRSLESLVRIAEVVEESVYAAGSLQAVPSGIRFVLNNPPLRLGAFGALRVKLDGVYVAPGAVRFRPVGETTWRSDATVGRPTPLVLLPGRATEFVVDRTPVPQGPLTVRLELTSVAIPPLVWFEFREPVRPAEGRP